MSHVIHPTTVSGDALSVVLVPDRLGPAGTQRGAVLRVLCESRATPGLDFQTLSVSFAGVEGAAFARKCAGYGYVGRAQHRDHPSVPNHPSYPANQSNK